MLKGFLTILLLIIMTVNQSVLADDSSSTISIGASNRSCIDTAIMNADEDNMGIALATAGLSVLALNIIIAGFVMVDADTEGVSTSNKYYDGSPAILNRDGTYAPRCMVPTSNIRAKYTTGSGSTAVTNILDFTTNPQGTPTPASPGQSVYLADQAVTFFYQQVGDMDCIKVSFGPAYSYTMGCKYRQSDATTGLATAAGCYAGSSCAGTASTFSLAPLPITSQIVQCAKESLYKMFIDPSDCTVSGTSRPNYFPVFQQLVRSIVMAAIILYVILFGIRVALADELVKKGEVFIFIIKLILVIYFAIGFTPPKSNVIIATAQNGVTGSIDQVVVTNNNGNPSDGISNMILPFFTNLGETLSSMIFQASGAQGLCKYSPQDAGYGGKYGYLSTWDSIDCHVLQYLGVTNPIYMMPMLFTMILPVMMSSLFIVAFIVAIFILLILSVVTYFVYLTVISLLAVSIIAYFGPLFIPLCLFKATKGYFDSWVRLLIGFALQPVIAAAFIGLFMTIFDGMLYGTCDFSTVTFTSTYKTVKYQVMDLSNTDTDCVSSLGYLLNGYYVSYLSGQATYPKPIGIFTIETVFDSVLGPFVWPLLQASLFMYFFYSFGKLIGDLAADLAGGPSLSAMTISPTAVLDKAVELAVKVADMYTGGAASKVKEVADKATKQDDKDGDGGGGGGGGGSSSSSGGDKAGGGGSAKPPTST